jgi:hypothetical protein
MHLILTDVYLAFSLAVLAWVFVHILQDEGMIFEWWQRILYRVPGWLAHPLGRCDRCMAGSLAFWIFLFLGNYNPVRHVCFVALTIFFVAFVDWLNSKFNQ